jgi:hypothetical protein
VSSEVDIMRLLSSRLSSPERACVDGRTTCATLCTSPRSAFAGPHRMALSDRPMPARGPSSFAALARLAGCDELAGVL